MTDTTAKFTNEIKADLIELLTNLIAIAEGTSDDDCRNTVTIGFSDDLLEYGYQTGNNSYSGTEYFYPNWVVINVYPDSIAHELLSEIQSQLDFSEELFKLALLHTY
ncbi:MAG: hypothetical protein RLZZ171_1201 [Cyanobacteriota bacterium]|jgi:hypothetical protein